MKHKLSGCAAFKRLLVVTLLLVSTTMFIQPAQMSTLAASSDIGFPDGEGYYQNLDGLCTYYATPTYEGTYTNKYVRNMGPQEYIVTPEIRTSYYYSSMGYQYNYGLLQWDTSAIPDSAIIQDVSWNFKPTFYSSTYAFGVLASENGFADLPSVRTDVSNQNYIVTSYTDDPNNPDTRTIPLLAGIADPQDMITNDKFRLIVEPQYIVIPTEFKIQNSTTGQASTLAIQYLPGVFGPESGYRYSCSGHKVYPGVELTQTTSPILTSKIGERYLSYKVVLKSRPLADVTLFPNSTETTAVTFSKSSLTFTAKDWDVPQTVYVKISNSIRRDQSYYLINHTIKSKDAWYHQYKIDPLKLYTYGRVLTDTTTAELIGAKSI